MVLPTALSDGDVGHLDDHEEIHQILGTLDGQTDFTATGIYQALLAARPAAGAGNRGLLSYSTDTDELAYSDGTDWHRIYRQGHPALDVTEPRFGALGDGSADDSDAVDDTLTEADDGDTILFPAGTYDLATWTTHVTNKSLVLRGAGAGRTIIVGPGSAQDFIRTSASLDVEGIEFREFATVIDASDVVTVIDHLRVNRCKFKDVTTGVFWDTSADIGYGVAELRVTASRFQDLAGSAVLIRAATVQSAWVTDNRIKDVVGRGIQIGSDSATFMDVRERMIVRGNIVQGLTGTNCIAIILYGRYGEIVGNIVADVIATSGTAEGIYTKCRLGEVIDNICIDAGRSEGVINVKGSVEGGGTTEGWAVVVRGNVLYNTQTGVSVFAIHIANEKVLVTENYIEGFGQTGGRAIAFSDSASGDNIEVSRNWFIDCNGDNAIRVAGAGSNIVITGNTFRNASTSSCINLVKTGGSDVEITHNRIYMNGLAGDICVGINNAAAIARITVDFNRGDNANRFLAFSGTVNSDVEVCYNRMTRITGSALSGSASHVTPAVTRGNTGDGTHYVTENNGTATIPSGATSITFAHGSSRTPSIEDVSVNPTNNLGNATKWWVQSVSSTNIRIDVNLDPGATTATFAWRLGILV